MQRIDGHVHQIVYGIVRTQRTPAVGLQMVLNQVRKETIENSIDECIGALTVRRRREPLSLLVVCSPNTANILDTNLVEL